MFRPNYYGRQRNTPPEWLLARTTGPGFVESNPVNFIAPIQGNNKNGVLPGLSTGPIYAMRNAGIPYNLIGRGVYFQYYCGWMPTASIGQLAIGISAIFVRKAEHEIIYSANGVDTEIGWGSGHGYGGF